MKFQQINPGLIRGLSTLTPGKELNPRIIIGIDPDIKKSGFAAYDKKEKKLFTCTSLPFFNIFNALKLQDLDFFQHGYTYVVKIEGSWLSSKSNWHDQHGAGAREKIAKNVGMNHGAGMLIVEMCEYLDCPCEIIQPITPTFKNEQTFQRATGWKGRTNEDARSAANYCFGY